MRAGRARYELTLERVQLSPRPAGQARTWVAVNSIRYRLSITPIRGTEAQIARAREPRTTHAIHGRYIAGLTGDMRFVRTDDPTIAYYLTENPRLPLCGRRRDMVCFAMEAPA